jgi:heterodisulfide reductase subunit A2
MNETRVGVFVCDCGSNIAGFVDVPEVVEYARRLPNVVWAQENMYTCSDAGRAEIRRGITEQNLNRVVVASCTPRTHEPLFRATCREAGLNPYLFEFVNVRDQCSWVHMSQRQGATAKAKDLVRMGVAKVVLLEPGEELQVKVVPAALVIGAGVAGLSAALSLANQGLEVKLVEREPVMGGLLRNLLQLCPTGDDAQSFIGEKVEAVKRHPNIEVFTEAEVRDVRGFVGNYQVAVQQGDRDFGFTVGAVVVATGAQVFNPVGMYGYDGQKVITQLELEKLMTAQAGTPNPHFGSVVMIQCVGARDETRPYCSRVCCMTAIQNALWIKEADPQARVHILYRDLLALGTAHEDLYREARGKGVVFMHYDPQSPPTVDGGQVTVHDELLDQTVTVPYDLVVLSTPLVGRPDAVQVSQMLKVPIDEHGFFLEAHAKLRPLDFATDGMYLCGSAHWPADVGQSVAQAYGAAARAAILLSRGVVDVEPFITVVDSSRCTGCGLCETVCPFSAIVLEDTGAGRKASRIPASCKGCGMCGAACPQQAVSMQHYTDQQLFAQVDALMEVAC